MAVERDKLNQIINMKEQELQREIAIATVRENMDEPIGAVLDQLGNISSEYQSALSGMSWRDILMAVVAEGSADDVEVGKEDEIIVASDPDEGECEQEEAEAPKPKKKSKRSGRKPPPRTKAKPDVDDFDSQILCAVNEFKDFTDDKGNTGASMGAVLDALGPDCEASASKVRGALNRLVEQGHITKRGSTRSTRYLGR